MRRCFAVAVAVLAVAGSATPAAAGSGPSSPACLRLRLGSSQALLTVGWYVGVWRALEDGALEFGLRLSLSRAPRPGCAPPRPEPAGVVALREPRRRPDRRAATVESLAGTVVAYGMLPGMGGVGRFLAEDDRP